MLELDICTPSSFSRSSASSVRLVEMWSLADMMVEEGREKDREVLVEILSAACS